MTPLFPGEASRLRSALPVIKRARGWRLYASDGSRYLDLCADGGRTVLGRRNGESGRVAKEAIDRGLVSGFPSFWKKRLEKQVLDWLPGYAGTLFFASEAEALLALAMADEGFASALRGGKPLAEALSAFSENLRVERPFGKYRRERSGETHASAADGRYALALLPLAPAWSFGILLGRSGEDISTLAGRIWGAGDGGKNGGTDMAAPIPAVRLAAAARSLSDFVALDSNLDEKRWAAIDPFIDGLFVRSGPWLYPAYPEAGHGRVFSACLNEGILISPDYGEPSIVPPEFNAGEVLALKSIPRA